MDFNIISRMLGIFTDIHEFIITNLFLWSIFTITSTLLTLQLQLVEYNTYNKLVKTKLIFSSYFLPFSSPFKSRKMN